MSDITTSYQTTTVSTSDGQALMEQLSDAASVHALTTEQLHAAVATTVLHEGLDLDSRSIGIMYIKYNLSAFMEVVAAEDRLAFFMKHITNPHIAALAGEHGILGSIPVNQRAEFLREVTSRYPMPDGVWLREAAWHGVDRDVLAELALGQLQNPAFDREAIAGFASSFLSHGSGRVFLSDHHFDYRDVPMFQTQGDHSMWESVSEAAFLGIVQLCAEYAPEQFFMEGACGEFSLVEKLTAIRPSMNLYGRYSNRAPNVYLDHRQLNIIVNKASQALTTLNGLSVDMLMKLPATYRRGIFERGLPGSLELLLRTTLENKSSMGYFREFLSSITFTRTELLEVFRNVHSALSDALRDDYTYRTAMAVDKILVERLNDNGYVVGKVVLKWAQGHGEQAFVSTTPSPGHRRITYVRRAQRPFVYLPQGTRVIIDTKDPANQPSREGATVIPANFISVRRSI